MGGAWHGAGRELFLGLGPNNRNNGNNGVWLAVVVLVVSNRLLFKPGSLGCVGCARYLVGHYLAKRARCAGLLLVPTGRNTSRHTQYVASTRDPLKGMPA